MTTRLECVTRVTITFIIATTVISSPLFMFTIPIRAATNSNRIDSSGYHSTPSVPAPVDASTLSSPTPMIPAATKQGNGDFTTQAALSLTRATQTNNIVNSKSYYDIMFRTSTSGIIKTIDMDFPAGTYVGVALLIEATGIGAGQISADNAGHKITYTVTNPENVPANTKIRIQLANINNPPNADSFHSVTITTKRAKVPFIIDGPTSTAVFAIRQIGTDDIANSAVTTSKIVNDAITPVVNQRIGSFVSLPPHTSWPGFVSFAQCNPDERAVGGGYVTNPTDNGESLIPGVETKAQDSSGWNVQMSNPTDVTLGFYAVAECMPSLP